MTSTPPGTTPHAERVARSALWAAWGDAVGFITERVSPSVLRKRAGSEHVEGPLSWTRRVGGKFGVDMSLPSGAYSDDTQLRLATSRAISADGFDAEAFAKVELPVWSAYALGGGRASKAAAASLAKPTVPWFGNLFEGYFSAGGNGVAMRIQPHVWSASSDIETALIDLMHNGITTHGHPRALVGAILHALALRAALEEGAAPSTDRWPDLLDQTRRAVVVLKASETLAGVWQPVWERETGEQFMDAWASTVDECDTILHEVLAPTRAMMQASSSDSDEAVARAYGDIATALGLRDPATTGSGTATVCAGLALVAAYPDAPQRACLVAANALGTDTDTIATMVGAILGASAAEAPATVQDLPYLREEAVRLSAIAAGKEASRFNYPDLLAYVPPRSQVDAVGLIGSQMAVSGLGFLQADPDLPPAQSKNATWIWTVSDFGQSFLLKTRTELEPMQESRQPPDRRYVSHPAPSKVEPKVSPGLGRSDPTLPLPRSREARGHDAPAPAPAADRENPAPAAPTPGEHADRRALADELNVDDVLRWVRSQQYDDRAVGYALRRLAESGTLEQVVAFATAIRYRRDRGSGGR